MTTQQGPRFLISPRAVIIDVTTDADPQLDPAAIGAAVDLVADTRAKQRRLAQALEADPKLLVSGEPDGPLLVELLVRALQQAGSKRVVLPSCANCGRQKTLPELNSEKRRICLGCATYARSVVSPCGQCGQRRRLIHRGLDGARVCKSCREVNSGLDLMPKLLNQLQTLDTGLGADILEQIVREAFPLPWHQRTVSGELESHPGLLHANAAMGPSSKLVDLALALRRHGAAGIAEPSCPSCGSNKRVAYSQNGMRCCRRCYESPRYSECGRCGKKCTPVSSIFDGQPICARCYEREPANHSVCTGCKQTAFICRRDNTGEYCHRCWRAPLAICSVCHRHKPCYFAQTSTPICEHCSRMRRTEACVNCSADRPVWSRTVDGAPLCSSCTEQRKRCADCGKCKHVAARTERGPLCSTCYGRDPISFRACDQCTNIERLFHHGLCPRCAADRKLIALFTDTNELNEIPSHLLGIYHTLQASDPLRILPWLSRSPAIPPLRQVLRQTQPITHQTLDNLLPNKAIHFVRAALVANGVLSFRDEHFSMVDRWMKKFLDKIEHPADRKLLASYGNWHHLRRLRHKTRTSPATAGQVTAVRSDMSNAYSLISWLRARDVDLAHCQQSHLDEFLAEPPDRRTRVGPFVRWAVDKRHAPPLEIPTSYSLPQHTIEQDHRWQLVKWLLSNESDIDPTDRLAGLLVLLFGQPASRIVRLRTDDLNVTTNRTILKLGAHPIRLPPPVSQIARKAIRNRRTHVKLGQNQDNPWLFPGRPGMHLSAARMSVRLNSLGIECRRGRNRTMAELAAQLPAAVLSKLLGIDVKTATRWSAHSNASDARYAAELARRSETSD